MSEIRMSQPTWRERTEARIGRDLRDRYRNLQPLLDLIEYRMEDVDAADDYRYGLSRLFLLDTLYGKKATTRAVADLICPLLWTLSKRMHRKTRKADPRLFFYRWITGTRFTDPLLHLLEAKPCTITSISAPSASAPAPNPS